MKKLTAMLLCMVMAFSLVGCGGGTDDKNDATSQNSSVSDGSEAESQPDSADDGSEAESQPDSADDESEAESQPDSADDESEAESQPDAADNDSEANSGDALSIMTAIWNAFPEDSQFAAIGGFGDSMVDGAPGKMDLTDTDTLTLQFMIPESVLANTDDIATLMHGMMANNFTGGAIHITNGDAAGAAAEVQTSVLGAQYMCGFPEKAVIVTTEEYVVYAFGSADILDQFKAAATENLDGVTVVYDGIIE